jgi:hypothetical protein
MVKFDTAHENETGYSLVLASVSGILIMPLKPVSVFGRVICWTGGGMNEDCGI